MSYANVKDFLKSSDFWESKEGERYTGSLVLEMLAEGTCTEEEAWALAPCKEV